MIERLLGHPIVFAVIAFLLGAALVGAVWAAVSAAQSPREPAGAGDLSGDVDGASLAPAPPSASPDPVATPVAAPEGCPAPTVTVRDAATLTAALAAAAPGDVIVLADGDYLGEFVATASGTAERPITLCGGAGAVLDGGDWGDGYVLHLDGASRWRLIGFTVTNGQKGVMADGTTGSLIQGLTVTHIGDEAIHLRRNSTDNAIVGNRISDTGLRREKFGEGVYIGSAESNWCDITDCAPDRSDRNLVEGNDIRGTTSEAIDVKEGTTGGVIRGNTFDGAGIVAADSWVDVKGNDWVIEGNRGANSSGDGFQTHEILDGWGTRNVFRDNVADVNGPGFGYSLTPVRDNVVACSNTASRAGEGVSNVTCSPG